VPSVWLLCSLFSVYASATCWATIPSSHLPTLFSVSWPSSAPALLWAVYLCLPPSLLFLVLFSLCLLFLSFLFLKRCVGGMGVPMCLLNRATAGDDLSPFSLAVRGGWRRRFDRHDGRAGCYYLHSLPFSAPSFVPFSASYMPGACTLPVGVCERWSADAVELYLGGDVAGYVCVTFGIWFPGDILFCR